MLDNEFEVFYPNEYNDEDARLIEGVRKSLENSEMGAPPAPPMPAGSGPNGAAPAGDSPMPQMAAPSAEEKEMLNYAKTWTPYNSFYTSKAYAESSDYGALTAFPGFIEPGARTPMLPRALGISGPGITESHINGDGMDHEIYFHKPIFPGDTFTVEQGKQWLEDITPKEGSHVRVFRVGGEAKLYNQSGDLVMTGVSRVLDCFKRRSDPSKRIPGEMIFPIMTKSRDIHHYVEEDWAKIRELWSQEQIRGAVPLYWEDVNIGDEPAPTCDGPITDMEMIRLHGAQIVDSAPLRDTLAAGRFMGLIRDDYGMFYDNRATHFCNRNTPGSRSIFFNTTGRNFIVRMVTNWMGDRGFLSKIAWRLMTR